MHTPTVEFFNLLCLLISLNLGERHEKFVGKLLSRLEASAISFNMSHVPDDDSSTVTR
jgi:hypothetical protein